MFPHNPVADCCNDRITLGWGNITMHRTDGSQVGPAYKLYKDAVTTIQVNPVALPTPAVTLENATEDQKQTMVRWVNVQAASGQMLNFKELMIFDNEFRLVSLNKPVTGTIPYVGAGDPSTYAVSISLISISV